MVAALVAGSAIVEISATGCGVLCAVLLGRFPMRAAPQSSQNFDEGSFSAVHRGQRIASGLPQLAQNFRPLLLSLPHLGQWIFPGP